MSEVIKIYYYFDDRSFHFKQLNKSKLISDLLQQIQEDHSDEDEIKTEKLGKSAFLNGKKLPETDSLEKYLDVLQYNALFISNDPTKELKVNLIPANKDDYQGQKDKKTGKQVILKYFEIDNYHIKNYVRGIYIASSLQLQGIVKVLGNHFSIEKSFVVTEYMKNKSLKAFLRGKKNITPIFSAKLFLVLLVQ